MVTTGRDIAGDVVGDRVERDSRDKRVTLECVTGRDASGHSALCLSGRITGVFACSGI